MSNHPSAVNGFGAFMSREIQELRGEGGFGSVLVETLGIPDVFVEHGGREELLAEIDLDAEGIARRSRSLLGRAQVLSAHGDAP